MIYINISGMYGCGAYEKPEYRALADLITDMDRLGVHLSVTAHVEARDLNTLFGNRNLMQDIMNCQKARDRILPSFAIAPVMMFAEDEYSFLEEHLASGQVQFVSMYPMTSRFAVREIEFLLRKIESYRPVVLVSVRELTPGDYTDLIDIAGKLPNLRFVILSAMWGQFGKLADLLTRCANIYVDTSHLHIRGVLPLITRYFGPGRTVFGLGSAALEGAAMAALQYADLDDSEKEAIAGGTILSLMPYGRQIEQVLAAMPAYTPKVKNSFWEPFIKGQGVKNTLVIDAHTHIGPMARGWPITDAEIGRQVENLEKDCQVFGIDQIVSSPEPALFGHPIGGCDLVERVVAGKEQRFRGYLPYNPLYASDMDDRFIETKLNNGYYVGFKVLPAYWRIPIADPGYRPVWTYAQKYRLPILIHTWEGTMNAAAQVAAIAAQYPEAIFIFGHSGGGSQGREEAIQAARQYDNVYLEFCGSFTARQRWSDTVNQVDPDRIVFGTDTYPHDIAWELGRLLSCDIDDQIMTRILGQNMQRIMAKRLR